MANKLIEDELLELLRSVDTPTVCNAIEVVQGQRGFAKFTRGTMICSDIGAPSVVGYAKTARIAALNPPQEDKETIRERRMAYYRYMSEAPRPAVAVIEDLDFPDCIGAYWGEINTNVHKGFGLSGALTNSVVRDLGDLPDNFPVIAGSIGPSHGFVHIKEIDSTVNIFGLEISPGDLIHADRHGALVIPEEVVNGLSVGIDTLLANEQIVLAPTRKANFSFEDFERAWEEFEKART
jgi:regulator of RNase E activity RraA